MKHSSCLIILGYLATCIQSVVSKEQLKIPGDNQHLKTTTNENGKNQTLPLGNTLTNKQKQDHVKEAFLFAWNGYSDQAWGHDEVKPVTGGYVDSRNGWGATIVDALDTLKIMGLNDEFEKAKKHVAKINWDVTTSSQIQVFETVIRYVGGLISAYELSGDKIFITKCTELVDKLLPAFDTKTSMPYQYVYFEKGDSSVEKSQTTNNLAEIGTYQLEFTRLSQITGDMKYYNAGINVYKVLNNMTTSYEGLYPHNYDINTGKVEDDSYGWGGQFDSFYEYLIKQYVLTNGKDTLMKEMYTKAARGLKKYLLDTPKGFDQLKFISSIGSNGKKQHSMGELDCFAPATLLLASHWIPETKPDQLDVMAKQLLDGCYQTWISTKSGLSPEQFAWIAKDQPIPPSLTTRQKQLAEKYGVYPKGYNVYILRPETIESIYYFYQYTKDPKYQDMAWTLFNNIYTHCKTKYGFSGVKDVDADPVDLDDGQESFLFAETFKYLYLMWEDTPTFPFDQWVFNTEAHPFRITK